MNTWFRYLLVASFVAPAACSPGANEGTNEKSVKSDTLKKSVELVVTQSEQTAPTTPTQPAVPPESVIPDADALYPVNVDGKWGYIDSTGKLSITPQFAQAEVFSEGRAAVMTGCTWKMGASRYNWACAGGQWGYIDMRGRQIVPAKFEKVREFHEGYAAVMHKGMWGFINETGKLVIAPQFSSAMDFSKGVALISIKLDELDAWDNPQKRYGFVRPDGSMAIPAQYLFAESFQSDVTMAVVAEKTKKEWGTYDKPREVIINSKGERLPHDDYDYVRVVGPNFFMAHVAGENQIRVINSKAETLFTMTNDDAKTPFCITPNRGCSIEVRQFADGLAAFINSASMVHMFTDGPDHGHYYMNGKWGVVNTQGKIVVPAKYEYLASFSEGLAAFQICTESKGMCDAKQNSAERIEKFGYIDTSGKVVLEPRWEWAGPFTNGVAQVSHHINMGDEPSCYSYIDRTGRIIFEGKRDPGVAGSCRFLKN